MNPEQQTFTDSVQSEDINRIMGNPHQRADYAHIQQFAEALGWLITSYAIKWGGMPQVVQTNGVDQQGLPFSNVRAE